MLIWQFLRNPKQGFYLRQVIGSDNLKQQRPILGSYESQLGFIGLLFGL